MMGARAAMRGGLRRRVARVDRKMDEEKRKGKWMMWMKRNWMKCMKGRETRLTVTEGLSSKVRHIELICLFGV
jgi:hypothetical protein